MFKIKKYQASNKHEWNAFVLKARNGNFLFDRNYMDYHSDRFEDHSLMFYNSTESLKAILPGNLNNSIYYSHQGLTFGGLVTSYDVTTTDYLILFNNLITYLSSIGISKIIYKKMPYIYSLQPNAEDEYALYRNEAKLTVCNISSTLDINEISLIHRSRKSAISKASRFAFQLKQNENWLEFWHILSDNLRQKFNSKPVHSLDEILRLHRLFPDHIHLFTAINEDQIEAGVVIYESQFVAHCQYISASQAGKDHCALDFIFNQLLRTIYSNKKYFDFGSSTENEGRDLNESLLFQKEGFGARAVSYNHYELEI